MKNEMKFSKEQMALCISAILHCLIIPLDANVIKDSLIITISWIVVDMILIYKAAISMTSSKKKPKANQ